jgi:hypothetical protein
MRVRLRLTYEMNRQLQADSKLSLPDRRATEITLTGSGWDEITFASHGHVDLVRKLFFDGVPDGLLEPLTTALESVYDQLVEHGTLPPPSDQS